MCNSSMGSQYPQMPTSFNQSGPNGGVATRYSALSTTPTRGNPVDPNGIVLMEGPQRNNKPMDFAAMMQSLGFPQNQAQPFSVNMNDPYAAMRQAAEGVPTPQSPFGKAMFSPFAAPPPPVDNRPPPPPNNGQPVVPPPPTPTPNPATPNPVTPNPTNPEFRPPKPTQMQPGQVRWDWNNSFGGGNKGWTPVFDPKVWTWANMLQQNRPAWSSQIDNNNFVQSVGQLSGQPYKGL